jgi:hypothetical protein
MEAKQKATKLIWEYLPKIEGWKSEGKTDLAKELALITVNQTLDIIRYHGTDIGSKYSLSFWLDVKQEINLL